MGRLALALTLTLNHRAHAQGRTRNRSNFFEDNPWVWAVGGVCFAALFALVLLLQWAIWYPRGLAAAMLVNIPMLGSGIQRRRREIAPPNEGVPLQTVVGRAVASDSGVAVARAVPIGT